MTALRFAMVTTFYPPHAFGGDAIAIQRLSRALVGRGHEVHVIHDVNTYQALAETAKREPESEGEPDGLRVHQLRSRLGAVSPFLTQQTGRPVVQGRRIRRILDEGKFDVIHFNNVSLVGGPGVLGAGSGIKLYEAHEHWLVCESHVLWRHDREPCTGRQCVRCVLRFGRPPQLWRYTGQLERQLSHIDAFIAKSEFSRNKHAEFGFTRSMEVLPYFLPDLAAERAGPPETGAREAAQRPFFLFVGRLERIKGLDDVIPAFASYGDAELWIAGDGTQREELERLAGGNPRVRFLGRVAPEELDAYYRDAIALIVPSVGFETFGIILIEAFRHGTPVIARRIGPFPEIIETARGGELFADREELVTVMRRLQGDPAHRQALAVAARSAFTAHWSESAVVPRYLDLVGRVAARNGRPEVARAAVQTAA